MSLTIISSTVQGKGWICFPRLPKQLFLLAHAHTCVWIFIYFWSSVCVGDCCSSVAMVMVELKAEAATVVEVVV